MTVNIFLIPLTNGGGRIMKKDIRFLITNSCNYGCYFCHAEGVSGTLGKHELTVDNYITLYTLYSELEGWNGVTLSGGEPFLFRDIDELLKRLYEAGAQVTVVTNGALLDRPSSGYQVHQKNQCFYSHYRPSNVWDNHRKRRGKTVCS